MGTDLEGVRISLGTGTSCGWLPLIHGASYDNVVNDYTGFVKKSNQHKPYQLPWHHAKTGPADGQWFLGATFYGLVGSLLDYF